MKCIVVMFDSLNRHFLPPYGNGWVEAPNFRRLAERGVTFERAYACSMPCMPARRELHTGRPNFLHRFWGPLEPFDDSVFEMLKERGVYSHLVTDHFHYLEDGGCTYHHRYNTWEIFRGHSGDLWKGLVGEPTREACIGRNADRKEGRVRQDWVNREYMREEEELMPQAQTVAAGLEFLRRNHGADNWLLQIEIFDPHEPFHTPRKYKDRYAEHFQKWEAGGGKLNDWPFYREVKESAEEVEHLRYEYAADVSMCDASLGKVLDAMDAHDLWKDTMLVVWTDHGFMLGEHGVWAKNYMPWYEEVSHTPFFVWDPRSGAKGERRRALVQPSLDLPVTLLDFFGMKPTVDMLGKNLKGAISRDEAVREAAIFGIHGGQVNVTDGRYAYYRAPVKGAELPWEYTMMCTHIRSRMSVERAREATFAAPFSFTKGCPLLRVPTEKRGWNAEAGRTLLFDLEKDPRQEKPMEDAEVERRMVGHLVRLMRECDSPGEQFVRLGLEG